MEMQISAEIRGRLDAHLDAVEKALVEAKYSRERRRGIIDDLEAQIMEMLSNGPAEPTLADLEAVLATLDPPAAYGEAGASEPVRSSAPVMPRAVVPRVSKMATWSCICVVLSLVFLMLAVGVVLWTYAWVGPGAAPTQLISVQPRVEPGTFVVTTQSAATSIAVNGPAARMTVYRFEPAWRAARISMVFFLLLLPLMLVGTMFGWVAYLRIRLSKGTLLGARRALFAGLFYPVTGFLLVVFTMA